MAGEVTRISREKYEAAMTDALGNYRQPCGTVMSAIDAFLAAVGIDVERSAGERIAAFVADINYWFTPVSARRGNEGPVESWADCIKRHFPEVNDDAR
jgi:hypothetical protein